MDQNQDKFNLKKLNGKYKIEYEQRVEELINRNHWDSNTTNLYNEDPDVFQLKIEKEKERIYHELQVAQYHDEYSDPWFKN